MKKLQTILYILLHIVIISCERQENPTPDFIIIGDHSNISINNLDTVIVSGYATIKSYEIDLDFDNNIDFRLNNYALHSSRQDSIPGVSIECLHLDASIYTVDVVDITYYVGRDTFVYNEFDTTYIHAYNMFDCGTMSVGLQTNLN